MTISKYIRLISIMNPAKDKVPVTDLIIPKSA